MVIIEIDSDSTSDLLYRCGAAHVNATLNVPDPVRPLFIITARLIDKSSCPKLMVIDNPAIFSLLFSFLTSA